MRLDFIVSGWFSAVVNRKQRRLTWIALALFVCTLLAAPLQSSYYGRYAPVFAVGNEEHIRFEILALEWVALGVIYVGLFFVFRKGEA